MHTILVYDEHGPLPRLTKQFSSKEDALVYKKEVSLIGYTVRYRFIH